MSRSKPLERDWVSLSTASAMLGVAPATVRRWSDAGLIRVFTTPGGHRRFSRAALEGLTPTDRSRRPTLGPAELTPVMIALSYRRARRELPAELQWVLDLTDEQRTLFRDRGHVIAAELLHYLDADRPESARQHLNEASVSAEDHGRAAAELGLSLSQTVEGFLRFRAPFFHALVTAARRRGFDTMETTDMVESAERGMDQLLLATMTGHSSCLVEGPNGHGRVELLESSQG